MNEGKRRKYKEWYEVGRRERSRKEMKRTDERIEVTRKILKIKN
jgi:hypothetical protein